MNLKQISALAHVSVSTVSRALNDTYGCSPETREQILKIAKDCGYFNKKKSVKHSNMRKGNICVAILCPEIISPHYSSVAQTLIDNLRLHGAKAIVYNYNFDSETKDIILQNCLRDTSCYAIVCFDNLPFFENTFDTQIVSCSQLPNCGTIVANTEKAVNTATEYLVSLGITDIAFIGEKLTYQKQEAFLRSLSLLNRTPFGIFISDFRFEKAGKDGFERLFSSDKIPKGIVCAYDSIAFGLVSELKAKGFSEDIKVIGINDIPASEHLFGGLTSVNGGYDIILRQIADDIINNCTANKEYICEPVLKIRNT